MGRFPENSQEEASGIDLSDTLSPLSRAVAYVRDGANMYFTSGPNRSVQEERVIKLMLEPEFVANPSAWSFHL